MNESQLTDISMTKDASSVANQANPLVKITSQYPIRVSLTNQLRPHDVLNLATTCQHLYCYMNLHNAKARSNILSRTLCPGRGLELRKKLHCPCFTTKWHTIMGCAGDGFDAESRPCADCGINTCNECRIHVTYQVSIEDPGLLGHRWWAGYVLTNRLPHVIYPPRGPKKFDWYLPVAESTPHHDEGRLHLNLQNDRLADPAPLDRILDVNLGLEKLGPYGRTRYPYDCVGALGGLHECETNRIELICQSCFVSLAKKGWKTCSCTFRKRFVDRWTCLPCHMKETVGDQRSITKDNGHYQHPRYDPRCQCGSVRMFKAMLCKWCKGRVGESTLDPIPTTDDDSSYELSSDSEDNRSGRLKSRYSSRHTRPNTPGVWITDEGTLAIRSHGLHVEGKRLGRALVERHVLGSTVDLPRCSCPDDSPGPFPPLEN